MKKVSKDYIIREAGTGRIYKITEDYNPITNYEPTEKEKQDFLKRETARLNEEKQKKLPINQVRRLDRVIRNLDDY